MASKAPSPPSSTRLRGSAVTHAIRSGSGEGFCLGARGGCSFSGDWRGVLFEGGYYSVSGGSIGLQIGGQTFSQAYFFTTPAALKTFQDSKGFDVGAGLDLAVANVATSGQISAETLEKPLVIFVWGQQGLMTGVKVQGQKITKLTNE